MFLVTPHLTIGTRFIVKIKTSIVGAGEVSAAITHNDVKGGFTTTSVTWPSVDAYNEALVRMASGSIVHVS